MEFCLSFNNNEDVLQLPVPPADFTVSGGTNVNVININDIGETLIIGKEKLSNITLSSFFPNQVYSFCQYSDFPLPYDCVKLIDKWKASGKPIRLIITGTNVNKAFGIESFEYGERDGTGDVYFTLSLKEYRLLNANTTAAASKTNTMARPVEKNTPSKYTVKKGDSLYKIALRVYGNGSLSTVLQTKNKIKDPKSIKVGQVLVV